MTRVQLTLAIAALPVTVAVLAGLAIYTGLGADEDSSGNPGSPSVQETVEAMDQAEIASQFFEAFPTKSYTSFEEAEQVAGYHIAHPSDEYPVAFGLTHLRWFPQFDRPLSSTHYTFPPLAPTSIGVNVKPSYYYPEGDKTAMDAEPMTVGGKTGWMHESETAWIFIFECGSLDGYRLWCQVMCVKKVGWEAFEHFVSTLE
jgi:hypothetical protein